MSSPIAHLLRSSYTMRRIEEIQNTLCHRGVFDFDRFSTGLFPAVGLGSRTELTSGYRSAWIRDNVHIAYAHYVCGKKAVAVQNVRCMAAIFIRYNTRFTKIIDHNKSPTDPINRPHIRYDGDTGDEMDEKWPHAQNDALGYFLWFFCTLVKKGELKPTPTEKRILVDFIHYFSTIRYWQDEDSGHWEEQRKISASSIGTVNAGLKQYRDLLDDPQFVSGPVVSKLDIDQLLAHGEEALYKILPSECIQDDPEKQRRFDAALLFLIDPLNSVEPNAADRILNDVTHNLQGDRGIARYPLDSYWGPDYRRIPEKKRTIVLSDDIIQRGDYSEEGKEAQWCIFDSIVSIIHGRRFVEHGDPHRHRLQTEYFNRALMQLVASPTDPDRLLIPEAYFVEKGRYVPNDHLPLQWAHANLWRCVAGMIKSMSRL